MMRKKTNYTNITPIPSHIPRKLAIDILHSHGEIITLNPLVLGFQAVKAPRDAPSDEYYATWYEIEQKIQFVPGIGSAGAGKIHFKGCFHDMDYGLQTHTYAPANVDLRNKWRICGNQPGEPREVAEIGIGAPAEGLYLREDVEIKCNITMASFVKKEMKAASKILVDRLIKKAELLDSGALQAMMEDGKLKTINPADRSGTLPPGSPGYQAPRPVSSRYSMGAYDQKYSQVQQYQQQQQYPQPPTPQSQQQHSSQTFAMELPGDYYHPGQGVPQHLQPQDKRASHVSELSGHSPMMNDGRWSTASDQQSHASSRPSSYSTDANGFRSPRPDQQSFGSDLAPMQETNEEHRTALNRLEGEQQRPPAVPPKQPYNPQDYAHVVR
ncbi:hypothetical protein EJ08DRAFT_725576 [Tothia fuscella]|uniref:DUF7053 domain-containing protein n=1 Tax=Tothia fuscella TaxID=1048955 RepID=A0A9P4U326_9PEZI|nr:hypothetical protein EJ08DRAFT_725576 [Tothia fuscella]